MMTVFGALVFLTALATAHGWCQVIRLESQNWQYAELTYIHGNGYVDSMNINNVEGGECELDKSYGFGPYVIWVDFGCRATFDVCFETDKCAINWLESWNWAYSRYTIPEAGRVLSMTLTELDSSAGTCIEGDTYGYLGMDAYVDDGCRAKFDICFVPGVAFAMTCESEYNGENVCDTATPIKAAVLQRSLSADPCIRDFSFFVEDTAIVTKRGCGADFLVSV